MRRSYSSEDTEDIQHCTVAGVAVGEGRYNLEVTQARAGNWVLLRGLGNVVQGTATVVARNVAEAAIFKPLEFGTQALLKLAIEPRKPSELPVMVEALRKAATEVLTRVREELGEAGEGMAFAFEGEALVRQCYTVLWIVLGSIAGLCIMAFCAVIVYRRWRQNHIVQFSKRTL